MASVGPVTATLGLAASELDPSELAYPELAPPEIVGPRESGRILVVEDEALVADVVRRYLALAGYEVTIRPDGPSALARMAQLRPHLVLLDLSLPGMDGMDVFRQLRARYETPVIMLTARAGEAERVAGLDAGADDYVTKPFFPRELVARVRRALARTAPRAPAAEVLYAGPVEINLLTRRVLAHGRAVALTALEFELLVYLVSRPYEVVNRSVLLEQVWGYRFGDAATVTVHIRRLRMKVELDPNNPVLITTAWGAGYRFEPGGA